MNSGTIIAVLALVAAIGVAGYIVTRPPPEPIILTAPERKLSTGEKLGMHGGGLIEGIYKAFS